MKSIIDIINNGQKKLEKLGSKTKFIISNPQKQKQIEKFEKKFKITLPEDYKDFIICHGLLYIRYNDDYDMYRMLDIESMIDYTLDLREDLPSYSRVTEQMAETVFPFQCIMDDQLQEYYVFRLNLKNNDFYIHDLDEQWNKLSDNKYIYADTFTDHINKFVDKIVSISE